jgi:hypothetical protein
MRFVPPGGMHVRLRTIPETDVPPQGTKQARAARLFRPARKNPNPRREPPGQQEAASAGSPLPTPPGADPVIRPARTR